MFSWSWFELYSPVFFFYYVRDKLVLWFRNKFLFLFRKISLPCTVISRGSGCYRWYLSIRVYILNHNVLNMILWCVLSCPGFRLLDCNLEWFLKRGEKCFCASITLGIVFAFVVLGLVIRWSLFASPLLFYLTLMRPWVENSRRQSMIVFMLWLARFEDEHVLWGIHTSTDNAFVIVLSCEAGCDIGRRSTTLYLPVVFYFILPVWSAHGNSRANFF